MQCKHHIPVKWLILHRHSAYIPITVADMKKKLYHHYIQLVGYIQITSKPWLQSLKNPQNILW